MKIDRNRLVLRDRDRGLTMRELGVQYDISPERAAQIIKRERERAKIEHDRHAREFRAPSSTFATLAQVIRWMIYGGGLEAFADFQSNKDDPEWVDEWANQVASL